MDQLDAIKAAFQRALAREVMGIEQIDAVLCEDGETIMLHGYTADPDVSYVATFTRPAVNWQRMD